MVLIFRSCFCSAMIAASYEPVSILWDVLGALEAMVRMQDPVINRAHSRAMYYDRSVARRRHRRSSSLRDSTNERKGENGKGGSRKSSSTVKTAVVLDVLRNAGLVSSIIALFALLPEDPQLVGEGEDTKSGSENEDDDNDEADEDETMLRDQLCKSAHLGGTVLQMLCRLDAACITDTEAVLQDSLDELLEINVEQLMPLERRFSKYLGLVALPLQLVERFQNIHAEDGGSGGSGGSGSSSSNSSEDEEND